VLYELLRGTAAIALRWYYADIAVQGRERAPRGGPLLVLANHPNALIDPLLVGTTVPRRVLLTAKATLFEHPALGVLLRTVGVVPLRRAKDETRDRASSAVVPERNAQAFAQVTSALRARQAVLVFPEGISHDDPALAPLKSGAARMALQANREGVAGIRFLPMGLVFEAKERPDSRVLVRVGDALDLEEWIAEHSPDPQELTDVLEARLRGVTLNFASAERAARAVHLARVLGTLAGAPAPVDQPESLDAEAAIALRIDAAVSALTNAPPHLIQAADALVSKLDVIERELRDRGIRLADVRVSTRLPDAVAFVVREGPLALLAGIAFVLGWANHWIPLRAARALALRSLKRDTSRDQPAMRTILFGLSAIVLWYVAQFVVVARIAGPLVAVGWLAVTFSAAHALRLGGGRLQRALQRARSFLALRADPSLQPRLVAAVDALMAEALALEQALAEQGVTTALPRA
jgi:glycerol-3-phosphate O-acyltransferase / dihydroxyacetone phosphate acyltransferase